MKFNVENPDYIKSPYTGMTREHWIEAGKFLLEGAFSHIEKFSEPLLFKRSETEITYPHEGDPFWRYSSEKFEGIARTFSIAAPLIKDNPDVEVAGYNLRDYYSHHILEGTNPNSPNNFGILSEMLKETSSRAPFQQTVELSLLSIGLMETKEVIWDRFTIDQQNQIAKMLDEYGHYVTCKHNWRFFNVLILTFLKLQGYKIDETILKDHLQNLLTYYAGDGWYRDGDFFDYYSSWAFQCYGPFWCHIYGYEYEPQIANAMEKNFNELMKHYTRFFDADGKSIMWGRSGTYRNCASAAFAAGFYLKNCEVDPGLARRILSGNLLQFIGKEETFENDIPCLGYYGPFKPMIQSYSCSASPFWMGKTFLGVCFDESAPLWQATETNGIWDAIGDNVDSTYVPGPGIHITNYGKNKTTEIRTSKFVMAYNSSYLPEYSRLAFNSAFPWEAYEENAPMAMNYVLRRRLSENYKTVYPNLIAACGENNGVLYRRMILDFKSSITSPIIDLADIQLDNGVIRVDRPRIQEEQYELLLGHYGLPHIDDSFASEKKIIDGKEIHILKTKSLQLAFIAYSGWDMVDILENEGKNAISKKSSLVYAKTSNEGYYRGMKLLVTIMLHKTDDSEWTVEELSPILSARYVDICESGSPCGIEMELRDGRNIKVDFGSAEGNLVI